MPNFLSGAKLAAFWDGLRSSFWFLPSTMAGAAFGLSFVLVAMDRWLGTEAANEIGWLDAFGPEGARSILAAIAGSMITVAGLTFSMTMLTLQLASSQFGPRLLRNFMRDRGYQIALGTFTATFVYCLLVLRTVRGTEGSHFVPQVAVAFGVFLALASIAVLIFFIHHVAKSIRIETLLADLAAETRDAVDRLYPEMIGDDPPPSQDTRSDSLIPPNFESDARLIRCVTTGYVQRVDVDTLMQVATEHGLIVRIEQAPGKFIMDGEALLSVHPEVAVPDEVADRLRGALIVGQERTPDQDLEFSIRRIVEIAQRALSPGINDPTTALYCIDRLGETFSRIAERDTPSSLRFDEKRRLRIVTEVRTLAELACPALAAVARYGIADADVVAKLLGTIDMLIHRAPPADAKAISDIKEVILRESRSQSKLAAGPE